MVEHFCQVGEGGIDTLLKAATVRILERIVVGRDKLLFRTSQSTLKQVSFGASKLGDSLAAFGHCLKNFANVIERLITLRGTKDRSNVDADLAAEDGT